MVLQKDWKRNLDECYFNVYKIIKLTSGKEILQECSNMNICFNDWIAKSQQVTSGGFILVTQATLWFISN